MLIAALTAAGMVGFSMWRHRVVAASGVAASIVAATMISCWAAREPAALAAGGRLVIWDGAFAQRDAWAYRSTLRAGRVSGPFYGLAKPVFASRQQMTQTDVTLLCDESGRPLQFTAFLEPDASIAFLGRTVRPDRPIVREVNLVTPVTPGGAVTPLTSPLYVVADQLYPGRVEGEAEEGAQADDADLDDHGRYASVHHWETVFVDNSSM